MMRPIQPVITDGIIQKPGNSIHGITLPGQSRAIGLPKIKSIIALQMILHQTL